MSLYQNIKLQMIEAMKARDIMRLNVLRGLVSAFTNEAIMKQKRPDEELADEEVLAIISRAVKQRKDSIEQFEKGGRKDLAESERAELVVLEAYLPQQMSRDEVEAYIKRKISEIGDINKSKKGQFMGIIMKELKGRADGALVKEVIDSEIVL